MALALGGDQTATTPGAVGGGREVAEIGDNPKGVDLFTVSRGLAWDRCEP